MVCAIMLMFAVPKWMHEALLARAQALGMSVGDLLQNIIANWCGHTITPEDKTE